MNMLVLVKMYQAYVEKDNNIKKFVSVETCRDYAEVVLENNQCMS